jgi:hypothetical protein
MEPIPSSLEWSSMRLEHEWRQPSADGRPRCAPSTSASPSPTERRPGDHAALRRARETRGRWVFPRPLRLHADSNEADSDELPTQTLASSGLACVPTGWPACVKNEEAGCYPMGVVS